MKKYILILLSTFAFAQTNTTTVGSLKLNNTPATATTNTKALVRNPSTKLIEEQLFTSTTPSWNQTLTVNSTASQNVTIIDPYNLYLRSGHLKLWHNVDADYADISIGSGSWVFNNSQFTDFEIDFHGFRTYKNGGSNAFFDNTDLTGDRNLKIPNIDGTLLTNSGTEVGKPISGDIELDNTSTKSIKSKLYGAYVNFVDDGTIDINSVSGSDVYISNIAFRGQIAGSDGITGAFDFSPNYTDNSYIQYGYINKRFAGYLESGTAIGSDLLVDLGDVNGDNNGTRLRIDDDSNTITTYGHLICNGSDILLQKGVGYATITNTSSTNRNLNIPLQDGNLALESRMVSKTTTQINALTGMQAGDYYFNTTLSTICFWDGTSWKRVSHSAM